MCYALYLISDDPLPTINQNKQYPFLHVETIFSEKDGYGYEEWSISHRIRKVVGPAKYIYEVSPENYCACYFDYESRLGWAESVLSSYDPDQDYYVGLKFEKKKYQSFYPYFQDQLKDWEEHKNAVTSFSRYLRDHIFERKLLLYVAWSGDEGDPIVEKQTLTPAFFNRESFDINEELKVNTLLEVVEQITPNSQLRRYAHIYVDTQQRFHGVYADKILTRRGLKLSGKLSYWDIDANSTDIEIIGSLERNPLNPKKGKLRIFCHYLDVRAQERLRENYGAPSGKMLARMTSSGRTVMLFPDDQSPFMLKFSGDFFAEELGFNNTLERKNIQQAIANYTQQQYNPYLIPEPVGVVIPKINFAFLQRALPLPQDNQLGSHDVLLGTSVILSDIFATTKLGKSIFSRMGSKKRWLQKVFAPKIADLIIDSLKRKIAHLELHPQNLDILIDTQTGEIKRLFVKDLEDMYQDPAALAAATGEFPQALELTRSREFGVLGEYISQYSLDCFYWQFLGQILGNEQYGLQDVVFNWLREKSSILTIHHTEYKKSLSNQPGDVFDFIATLRDLVLKNNLKYNFCQNESARQQLVESEGTVISNSKLKAFAFTHYFSNLEFGFVGNVPVAISRDLNGIIKDYYFKFKTI